jgi:hypothetical protein
LLGFSLLEYSLIKHLFKAILVSYKTKVKYIKSLKEILIPLRYRLTTYYLFLSKRNSLLA